MLNNKTIFLAGATGMVGTNLCKYLIKHYPKVRIKAPLHLTQPVFEHRQIEYMPCNLLLVADCRNIVQGCDYAILAATLSGGAQWLKAHQWVHMKANLKMNLNMLEACYLFDIKKIIFLGSALVYQEADWNIKEDMLDLNTEPFRDYYAYGWAMRFIEKMCGFIHRKHNVDIIMLRAANIYGPYDRFVPEASHFIPALIRKATDKMEPFEVWGSADVVRDVIYVADVVRAIVGLLNSDIKFDIFNIGTGHLTTVGDVVKYSLQYAKHRPKQIKYSEAKPSTIKFRQLDCEKIRKAIKWKPQYTLKAGIKKTVEWWIGNKETWER
jgi:GDP-L-fucose synthase